jgi:anti-sigma28 factor (negative regulator of flagellin synthesis)
MITNDIINKVAQLIRTQDPGHKDPKEIKVNKELLAPKDKDAVVLSQAGESYAHPAAPRAEYEKDQIMKVERLKALVQKGSYKIDEEMANTIAERIARELLT